MSETHLGIVTQELSKTYKKRQVVKSVSLRLMPGEIVGILGPNGAGKTTSFNMVVGLVKPDSGKVFIDGDDVSKAPIHHRARKGLGYLPQEPSIFTGLTVGENMMAIAEFVLPQEVRKARVEELLEEFNILRLKGQKSTSLSGGERRRLEIARSLLSEPRYLLLDEPFSGVDPISVQDLQGILRLLKKRGLGILITDHNVRETLEIVNRAYLIYEGKVFLEGDRETLLSSEEAKKYYFGSMSL